MREDKLAAMPEEQKDSLIRCIWYTLYPDGDMDHIWSSDELEEIATIFAHAELTPKAEED